MKTRFICAAIAALPLTTFAQDANKYLRAGDKIEFTRETRFANPNRYSASFVTIEGRKAMIGGRWLQCSLRLLVPANGTSVLKAGRRLEVTDAWSKMLELEKGIRLICFAGFEGQSGVELVHAGTENSDHIVRSLWFLKVRKPLGTRSFFSKRRASRGLLA